MYYGTKKNKKLGRKENRWERDQNNQERGRNKGGGGRNLTKKKRKYPHQVRPSPGQKDRGQDPYCRQSQPPLPLSQSVHPEQLFGWEARQAGAGNTQALGVLDRTRSLAPPAGRTGYHVYPQEVRLDANISTSQRRKLRW